MDMQDIVGIFTFFSDWNKHGRHILVNILLFTTDLLSIEKVNHLLK